jgi:hypothetical protein
VETAKTYKRADFLRASIVHIFNLTRSGRLILPELTVEEEQEYSLGNISTAPKPVNRATANQAWTN